MPPDAVVVLSVGPWHWPQLAASTPSALARACSASLGGFGGSICGAMPCGEPSFASGLSSHTGLSCCSGGGTSVRGESGPSGGVVAGVPSLPAPHARAHTIAPNPKHRFWTLVVIFLRF